MDRLVNNYIKQKKFKEGREFLSPVIDKLMVIGADHSAMMRVELLMHNIKEELVNQPGTMIADKT